MIEDWWKRAVARVEAHCANLDKQSKAADVARNYSEALRLALRMLVQGWLLLSAKRNDWERR